MSPTPARITLAVAASVAAMLAMTAAQTPPLSWTPQTSGVSVRLRGVSAISSSVAWASGGGGTVLRTTDGGRTWHRRSVPGADALDFRDVDALNATTAVVLSIGNGAASRIYRTTDGGATWTERFRNADPKAFFDAMAFGDTDHGVAFSDSVDGRFVIRTTADAGRTWVEVPAERLPPALPDEGAFAASGTNVAMLGPNRIWIGTSKSRVLRSTDGGRSWTVHPTPIATGEATGIFSITFRDATTGVVVGGNYQREDAAVENVAITIDGGTTWTAPATPALSGFRSAIASLPVAGRPLLAVGPRGSDWSRDGGRTWTPAGGAGYDAFSAAPSGDVGWATGAGGRIARVTFAR
jgi:photosystem II stability/assembly factor-like uncharacterized protein